MVVLDEVRLGRSRSRSELVARTGLGRAIVAQRVGELLERGLVVEGDVGPEHGRPAAAPARVPRLGGTRPRRGPRRDEHRRRRHGPRRADPRPPRRAVPDRGRPGRLPGSRRRAVRPAAPDDARHPRVAVGDRHRRSGPRRVPGRAADLAADHARLGRLSDPGTLRRSLRRAGLGRQRRQCPRARRVALGRRRRPRRRRGRQDRDRHRRRDHLGRAAPPRRPGERRRRRPHPDRRRRGGGVPLRQHRLPGGAGRWRGDRARPARRPRSTGGARGSGPLSISAARSRPRTSPGQRRSAIPSRSPCCRMRAAASGRCSRASSTSSIRR